MKKEETMLSKALIDAVKAIERVREQLQPEYGDDAEMKVRLEVALEQIERIGRILEIDRRNETHLMHEHDE
jgi:signal transduction histidine kinase